ncbi:MAG: membrane-bound O-acyltransferase family protein [Phycisphaeraceae bacterium]|nr:membrane-bound O-acyltransferase family protein [Phycisphaeraceae bacterium]
MTFNSLTFVIFLLAVLGLHNLPLSWRTKKFNLLWASYLFYAAWNPPFVILLWISTVVDWYVSRWIANATGPWRRRVLLTASLATNLGMLGIFKYGNFLLDNFTDMMQLAGVDLQPAPMDIVLPVGISFYTFQTLSYTMDVYLKKMKPWDSFLDYAMYVTFFPQLVAGPIVRAADFLPQCHEVRRTTSSRLGWGLTLLTLGLFEKVVVADGLMAPITEAMFDAQGEPNFVDAWCGTFAFAGQVFCDFAGYSTCAIGVAMALGFAIPDNFRFPYAAIGFTDFWQRWHISLSSWLRDYLYIPLGGNRRGSIRTYVNLMGTMLLGGLWHGASWTFVAWGGLHGAYLVGERLTKRLVKDSRFVQWGVVRFAAGIGTFLLVCVSYVFFRSDRFDRAFGTIGSMLGRYPHDQRPLLSDAQVATALIVTVLMLTVHWLMRGHNLEAVAQKCPAWIRVLVIAVMLVAIVTMPGEDRAFIYFQF